MAVSVTTIERVKGHLNTDSTFSSGQEALLTQFITTVSLLIEKYLNRSFEIKLRTEVKNVGRNQHKFLINGGPILSVVSIKSDYSRDFSTTEALETEDYTLRRDIGQVIIDKVSLTPGFNSLQIVYWGGFSFPIPDDGTSILKGVTNDGASVSKDTGDKWLVGSVPVGDFVGQETGAVATWNGLSWDFTTQTEEFILNYPDIATAAEKHIGAFFRKRYAQGQVFKQVKSSQSTFIEAAFDPEVRAILKQYRRIRLR